MYTRAGMTWLWHTRCIWVTGSPSCPKIHSVSQLIWYVGIRILLYSFFFKMAEVFLPIFHDFCILLEDNVQEFCEIPLYRSLDLNRCWANLWTIVGPVAPKTVFGEKLHIFLYGISCTFREKCRNSTILVTRNINKATQK